MLRTIALSTVFGAMLAGPLQAEERLAAGEQVIQSAGAPPTERTPLPVTLDFSLPQESEWLAKINANPTLSKGSPAEKALTSTLPNEQPISAGAPAPAALSTSYHSDAC